MHTNVHCSTVHIAKTWNQPKCPSMIDWTGKMWYIYTMEYCAAIKNDEIVSFVGTWMNLETIILSKLKQAENQTPHVLTHRRVLNNENTWTQRGEHTTHWGLLGEKGEGQQGMGSWGEITWGEMPDMGEGEEGSKSHSHMCTYATILHVFHMYPKT